MTIVEFLEARLAEDEATWPEHLHEYQRMTREVAAKRAIIAEHRSDNTWNLALGDCAVCAYEEEGSEDSDGEMSYGRSGKDYPCPTVLALASVYADHPDYDQGWALAGMLPERKS